MSFPNSCPAEPSYEDHMNVTRPETDDVVTQLETFVMMLPNIAMWGDVTPSRATTAAARRTDNRVAHGYLSPRCIVFSRQGRSHSGHGGPGTFAILRSTHAPTMPPRTILRGM